MKIYSERETGFELAASYLASRHSTTELLPQKSAADKNRTRITCSSDKRLDQLGNCGKLSIEIIPHVLMLGKEIH